jgi:hypothetical protein
MIYYTHYNMLYTNTKTLFSIKEIHILVSNQLVSFLYFLIYLIRENRLHSSSLV